MGHTCHVCCFLTHALSESTSAFSTWRDRRFPGQGQERRHGPMKHNPSKTDVSASRCMKLRSMGYRTGGAGRSGTTSKSCMTLSTCGTMARSGRSSFQGIKRGALCAFRVRHPATLAPAAHPLPMLASALLMQQMHQLAGQQAGMHNDVLVRDKQV